MVQICAVFFLQGIPGKRGEPGLNGVNGDQVTKPRIKLLIQMDLVAWYDTAVDNGFDVDDDRNVFLRAIAANNNETLYLNENFLWLT